MKKNIIKIGFRLQGLLLSGILLILFSDASAQKKAGFNYISRVMYTIPESLTYTTDDLAAYVSTNFSSAQDRSRAIFIWISRNINYNFDSIITNSIYETPSEVSERILRTRTGVCLNFAHLFNEISNKAGIKSYIIQGYTKQNGRVDFLPHIWCASYIDTAWYLFDPTWGSGYVSRGRYVNQFNGYYFMSKPEKMIRSHMPFDPMWQFLNYSVTHYEFKRSGYRPDTTQDYFNFVDTLAVWERSSELEKAIASARRIEKSGVTNNFVAAKLRVVKGDIEYISNKMAAEQYQSAVGRYNEGIRVLNRFIGYRNEQVNDSLMLSQLLDTSEACFNSAFSILDDTRGVDNHIVSSINNLKKEITDTQMMLNLQRAAFISQLKTRNRNQSR